MVTSERPIVRDGRRTFWHDAIASTDESGSYCLSPLEPGEYYVVADRLMDGSGAILPTFYPNASDRMAAKPYSLKVGEELRADFRLTIRPTYRVRGTYRNSVSGEAVQISLVGGPNPASSPRVTLDASNKSFEITGVLPGSYRLRATQMMGTNRLRGEQRIQIVNSDVGDLVINLARGVAISGAVRGRHRDGRTAPYSVVLEETETHEETNARLFAVSREDGTFKIENVFPGLYRVVVSVRDEYVASIVSGGELLPKGRGFVVSGEAPPPLLDIMIGQDGGSISGTVDDTVAVPDGTPVLLVAGDEKEPRIASVFKKKFQFEGLEPGEYSIFVLPAANKLEYRNADVVRSLKGGATVSVNRNATARVVIKTIAE
jgi:hypothetical protein